MRQRFRQLSDRLLKPIESYLADVDHLIICPEGELWLLPWAALPMQDGRLLLERCAVSHRFTAGELLDRPPLAPRELDRALIFADADFDATPAEIRSAEVAMLGAEQRDAIRIPSEGVRRLLPQADNLPGTASEAQAAVGPLRQLTGKEPYVYRGKFAVESLVKSLHSPEYLVFATHSVYLPTPEGAEGCKGVESVGIPIPQGFQPLDLSEPLVRSAIMLTGANQCDRWGEIRGAEGILAALEVALLDLRGTKLVVLSGCDTGVGQLRYGDGVSGLRLAFFTAGSRAVVASLWSVEDTSTAELMASFFENLSSGDATHVALRDAQLKQLQKYRRLLHGDAPFFWAGFTLQLHNGSRFPERYARESRKIERF